MDTAQSHYTSARPHAGPLSVAIPRHYGATGPYCPRKPNLHDILQNTAPPPWTLSAFMAYLSQNHCLETLEFTMDSSRYRKHYNKVVARAPGGQISPISEDCNYIKMLWQRLMEAYIVPNGPREVNLPSDVRDSLLKLSDNALPPHPSSLDTAVAKVYELMEESVLVPFLNSVFPQTAHPDGAASGHNSSDENLHQTHSGRSYDDRSFLRSQRRSSPPVSASLSSSTPTPHNRASAPSSFSHFARSLTHSHSHSPSHSRSSRHSSHTNSSVPNSARTSTTSAGLHNTASNPHMSALSAYSSNTTESSAMSIDDNTVAAGSASSVTNSASPSALSEPMTPPTTPPMCDFSTFPAGSTAGASCNGSPVENTTERPPIERGSGANSASPRSSVAMGVGQWGKKLGGKLGWKKKSTGGLREEDMMHGIEHESIA